MGENNIPAWENIENIRGRRARSIALSDFCYLITNASPFIKGDMKFFEVPELTCCLKHTQLCVKASSLSLTV